jgi:hypothetical protein
MFWKKKTKDNLIDEATTILLTIKEKVTDTSGLIWTSYETAEELRDDIEKIIKELKKENPGIIDDAYSHFVPTSTFQEHAMQNGWTDEYMMLAERFDKVYEQLKAKNK